MSMPPFGLCTEAVLIGRYVYRVTIETHVVAALPDLSIPRALGRARSRCHVEVDAEVFAAIAHELLRLGVIAFTIWGSAHTLKVEGVAT